MINISLERLVMKAQVTMLLVRRWRSVNVLKYLLIRGTLIVINVSYLTAIVLFLWQ